MFRSLTLLRRCIATSFTEERHVSLTVMLEATLGSRKCWLAQTVIKSGSLAPVTPRATQYLHEWKKSRAPNGPLISAAIQEAIKLKRLSPIFWRKFKHGPFKPEQLKALDMRTLTFLYYGLCYFSSNNLFPETVRHAICSFKANDVDSGKERGRQTSCIQSTGRDLKSGSVSAV